MTCSLSLSGSARPTVPSAPRLRAERIVRLGEESLAAAALVLMVLLPLAEIVVRAGFVTGIPGAGPLVQHLTLWVGFIGAGLAARDERLLSIATGAFCPHPCGDGQRCSPRASPWPSRQRSAGGRSNS
jgi:hypothetical protein